MFIDIQRKSGISITKQIELAIIDQIFSGFLKEGEQLPSVRALAKQLNVSFLTVVKAYQELEQKDYLYSVQGRGTFVCGKNEETVLHYSEENLDWQLAIQDYLPRSQFSQFHHSKHEIHLSSSMVDPELLPSLNSKSVLEKLLAEDSSIFNRYGEIQGDIHLRLSIQKHLSTLGIQTDSDHILVTNGSQQAIDLVARTFVGPGDVVILEAPTYPGAIDVFRNRGVKILTVPVDHEGMRIDILQQLLDTNRPKIIYTIPTFQNPTGTLMSTKRRRQLLEIAQNVQCLIIEDDPWSEIYYNQKPPAPIKSNDEYGHVIYLKGLSKTLAPGCRIGFLTASGSIFKRLLAAKSNTDLGTPLVTQRLVLPLIQPSFLNSHMQSLRNSLRNRRDIVIQILSSLCPKEVTWYTPNGGLNLWISLPEWVQSHIVLLEANKKGISFLPGSACFSIDHENHHIRISFSFINEEMLYKGVTSLCHIITDIIKRNQVTDHSPYF